MGPGIAGRPAAGATTGHFTFDWASASITVRAGFPDASKGDVEYVYQRATRPVGSASTAGVAHVASRFQRIDSLTLREGSPASVQASLVDAPQSGTVRADLRNAQFAALLPQLNPHATPSSIAGGVSVISVPHSIEFPDQPDAAATSLIWVQGPATVNVDYGLVSYGQFLGPMWKEMRYVLYTADVNLPVPGSSATYPTGGALISYVPASAPTPVAPELGPPTSVRIEGRDAFTSQSSVGVSPRISWSPPTLGTASSYIVKIDLVNLGPPANELQEVAISVYSGTSIQVPPGLLQAGRQYTCIVTAVSAPWDVVDRAPFRTGTPLHMADSVSAIFSP